MPNSRDTLAASAKEAVQKSHAEGGARRPISRPSAPPRHDADPAGTNKFLSKFAKCQVTRFMC
jgi:hypothetical protein